MVSKEAKKFILSFTWLLLYTDHANASTECNHYYVRQMYTEIGCKPIYGNGGSNNTCPVAYNCEHVFTRPRDKCYFNGNVYQPNATLSVSDMAKSPCLNGTTCIQEAPDSIFHSEIVTSLKLSENTCTKKNYTLLNDKKCYYEFDKNSCCKLNLRCLKENEKVHECVYNNKTYRNKELIEIHKNLECICSPEFNGTVTEKSCRRIGCFYEINNIRNILNRDVPVWFKLTRVDDCPIMWYNSKRDVMINVTPPNPVLGNKTTEKCKYGNLSFSLGQNMTIKSFTDAWCSCEIPPLITCIWELKLVK